MLKKVFLLLALFMPSLSQATEVAGINYPASVTLPNNDKTLHLNGAGIRYKIFFKIYAAALYVEKTSSDANEILADTGAKRLQLNILYDEISKQKMIDATLDGFADNLSDAERNRLAEKIKLFNQYYDTVREGDVLVFDYVPGQGTYFSVNGKHKGVIDGLEFNQALLKIWIGEYPATDALKRDLLHQEESY